MLLTVNPCRHLSDKKLVRTHYTWASPKGWGALGSMILKERGTGFTLYGKSWLGLCWFVPGYTYMYLNMISSRENTVLSFKVVNKHCLLQAKVHLFVSILSSTTSSKDFISFISRENTHKKSHILYRFTTLANREDWWINLSCCMQHVQFFQERQEMYPNRSTETWNTPKNNPKQASAIPYGSVGKASIHSENSSEQHCLNWHSRTAKDLNPKLCKSLNSALMCYHNLEGPLCRLSSVVKDVHAPKNAWTFWRFFFF